MTTANESFPTSAEALTAGWLAEKLGCEVRSFRVSYFGEGAGIIGLVCRVHIDSPDGPETIIAKFPSPAEENRAVAQVYDMYGREVSFYQKIAPRIDARVPQCYYAAMDVERYEFVILMEDLQGFRIGDQVAGCSAADAENAVRAVAKLHASCWEPEGLGLVSHNNPSQRDGMMAGFGVGWPVVTEVFADLLPDRLPEDMATRMPAAVPSLLERMCTSPVSLCHADVRLDNIFFAEDGISLVDWQSVCTSAPEQDLAYFVTQSLPAEVRRSRDWVALYHEVLSTELAEHGVRYTLEQCRQRFQICALYLLCYATVIAGTLDLGNERGKALGRTLFGNAMASLDELDAFSLLADSR